MRKAGVDADAGIGNRLGIQEKLKAILL